MALRLWVPSIHRLAARNWNLARSGWPATKLMVLSSVWVSTPLRGGRGGLVWTFMSGFPYCVGFDAQVYRWASFEPAWKPQLNRQAAKRMTSDWKAAAVWALTVEGRRPARKMKAPVGDDRGFHWGCGHSDRGQVKCLHRPTGYNLCLHTTNDVISIWQSLVETGNGVTFDLAPRVEEHATEALSIAASWGGKRGRNGSVHPGIPQSHATRRLAPSQRRLLGRAACLSCRRQS